jgi:hypothetical protein
VADKAIEPRARQGGTQAAAKYVQTEAIGVEMDGSGK